MAEERDQLQSGNDSSQTPGSAPCWQCRGMQAEAAHGEAYSSVHLWPALHEGVREPCSGAVLYDLALKESAPKQISQELSPFNMSQGKVLPACRSPASQSACTGE